MVINSPSFRSRFFQHLYLLIISILFGLTGFAPLINEHLYRNKMIYFFWLMALSWKNIVLSVAFSLLFWGLAIGFLIVWARRLWRKGAPGERATNETKPGGRVRILRLIGLILGMVATGIGLFLLFGLYVFADILQKSPYQGSVSSQGHVYHLAIEQIDVRWGQLPMGTFVFQISQCDASGWFCRVVDERTQDIGVGDNLLNYYVDDLDANMQIDPSQTQLIISYQDLTADDKTGEIAYPLP
ncbi:MAG: hypothetical protein J2P37_11560 [Ktedonobacteraceae bacterium]|nr:hypothetical protein [Ktedonobacteraceae bacterium]MBO0790566.1 hypothetical protein [Ktedonobacteraceae bacterium]